MGCGEGAAGTQHPRIDGVTRTLAASTQRSCSWHRSRVLQDVGPGGHRVKGSPGPCALIRRERERLAASGAVGRRLEGGEAGGTGVGADGAGSPEARSPGYVREGPWAWPGRRVGRTARRGRPQPGQEQRSAAAGLSKMSVHTAAAPPGLAPAPFSIHPESSRATLPPAVWP